LTSSDQIPLDHLDLLLDVLDDHRLQLEASAFKAKVVRINTQLTSGDDKADDFRNLDCIGGIKGRILSELTGFAGK